MKQTDRGFTLIEVLIAITLLGVMVVLLFASLRIAAESWDAGEKKISQVNRRMVVYQFFKRHLADIRPLNTPANPETGQEAVPIFEGKPQSLRFVASMPASAARRGLQVFSIAPARQNPHTIQVSLRPYPPRQSDERSQPDDLLHDVESLRFAYFGKLDDTMQSGQWQEQWFSQQTLPSLIKVSIRLKEDTPWLDMLLPLHITGLNTPDAIGADDQTDASPSGGELPQ